MDISRGVWQRGVGCVKYGCACQLMSYSEWFVVFFATLRIFRGYGYIYR